MEGRITYNYGAVDSAATNATTCANEMKQLFADLMQAAKQTCGESWQGKTSEAFIAAQAKWNARADAFADGENRCGVATHNAASNAHAADVQGAGLFA